MPKSDITRKTEIEPAVVLWQETLLKIRNMSPHTAIAYGHDVRVFAGFLSRYRGHMIAIEDLEKLDLRPDVKFYAAMALDTINTWTPKQ